MKNLITLLQFFAVCLSALALINCGDDANSTSVIKTSQLNLNIKWLKEGVEADTTRIDSVRVTVNAVKQNLIFTQTISFEDRAFSFEKLPTGEPLVIKVQGLDKYGSVIFEGMETIEDLLENGAPVINAHLQAPLAPSSLTTTLTGSNKHLLEWQPQSDNWLFFEIQKIDTITPGTPLNPQTGLRTDTSWVPSSSITTDSNKILDFRVRAYNSAGYSPWSHPLRLGPKFTLNILSHANPDTVNFRVASIFGIASALEGISQFKINDSTLVIIDNHWQLKGVILDTGENVFNFTITDDGADKNIFNRQLSIYYDPDYQKVTNRSPKFLSSATNLAATLKSNQTYTKILKASDPDEFNEISINLSPSLVLTEDSILTWVPTLADTGINHAWAIVTDQDGARDSMGWEITVIDSRINTPPFIYSNAGNLKSKTTYGQLYEEKIYAVDLEDGIDLKYSVIEGKPSIDSNGNLSWYPDFEDIGTHTIKVQVEDDSGAITQVQWILRVNHPSIKNFNAGYDQIVSISDTIYFTPIIELQSDSIIKYQWYCHNKWDYIEVSKPDTQLVAPDTAINFYTCALRITLSGGDSTEDSVNINVIQDKPRINLDNDVYIFEGETKTYTGVATDTYGVIVKWEWKIGSDTVFSTGADTISVTMPLNTEALSCSLRVTDDDGNITIAGTQIYSTNIKTVATGTFTMGSAVNSDGDETQHDVELSPFKIDAIEVSQKEYFHRMGVKPSGFGYNETYPVESVTWYDAVLFCNAKSIAFGFDTVYTYDGIVGLLSAGVTNLTNLTINYAVKGFRLPTEAEWEYAARGGAVTEYHWGDSPALADTFAVYDSNSSLSTAPSGSLKPNGLDLYDMAGNVWEWCNDWYGLYPFTLEKDPTGPAVGAAKVIRGGSWMDNANTLRSAERDIGPPAWKSKFVGFRTLLPL